MKPSPETRPPKEPRIPPKRSPGTPLSHRAPLAILVTWGLIVALLTPATSRPARAEEAIVKLTNTLLRHKSYKVRLQAAVIIARKRDKRALHALMQCLQFDSSYLVRALCATALGRLGRIKAKKLLEAARKDKSSFVRKRAVKALQALRANHVPTEAPDWSIPPKRRARYFVMLGSMATRRGKINKAYRRRMQRAFWSEIGDHKRFTMGLAKFKAPQSYIRKHKLKAYVLDASLVKLKARNRRRRRRYKKLVTAKIRVTLAAYPKMNIVMITTGTASASQGHNGRLPRSERRDLYHRLKLEALDNAAQSASRNVMRYLKSQ